MNIPGPRKQPSVSPPGQFPGQAQLRTQQHFATRGTTPPVNIRSQTPEAAFEGQQLQYQRVVRPQFSSSPTGYTQLGSAQQVSQVAQASQQQLRATQPTLQVITPENQAVPSLYLHPVSGQQSSQAGSSPRPQTLQLTSQHQVTQVYPSIQPGYISAQSSAYARAHSSQQAQQVVQQQQQQQQQNSFQSQQGARYQQSGPQLFSSRRPRTPQQQTHTPAVQVSDGQVNLGLPHNQQTQQVLISQTYTQGTVPHDISKASLGITAPQRGQTPPQAALQTGIMYNQQAPPTRHPGHQNYARSSMASNRQPQPSMPGMNNNATNMFRPVYMSTPVQLVQPGAAPSLPFQYPGSQIPQQFTAMTSQPQNMYPPPAFFPGGNQVYMSNHGQYTTRLLQQQPANIQPVQEYRKRERKMLQITDPNTGEILNLDSVATNKSSNTPPQSGASSSRDTPVSSSTPPSHAENDNIKAQFATQVAARLGDKPGTMQQPQPVPPPGSQNISLTPQMGGMQQGQQPVQMTQLVAPALQQLPAQQQLPASQQPLPLQPPVVPLMQRSSTSGPGVIIQHNVQSDSASVSADQATAAMLSGAPSGHAASASLSAQPPACPSRQQPLLRLQPPQMTQMQPPIDQVQHVVTEEPPVPQQKPACPQPSPPPPPTPPTPPPPVEQPITGSSQIPSSCAESTTEQGRQSPIQTQKAEVPSIPEPASSPVLDTKQPTPSPVNNGSEKNEPVTNIQASEESSEIAPSINAQMPVETSPDDVQKSELDSTSSTAVPPVAASMPDAKDRRKKGTRARSKETNTRVEKAETSEADASGDTKISTDSVAVDSTAVESSGEELAAESAAPSASVVLEEAVSEMQIPSEPHKETSSITDETTADNDSTVANPSGDDVNSESQLSNEEQRRVAERNEKNSKEHSELREPADEPLSGSTVSTGNVENHLDVGEATIEKPEPVIKKNELKYKYREDQCRPLNPEGKKRYDRNFLLQLQYSSESLEKPDGLPQLPDVVLDTPVISRNEKPFGQSSNSKGLDFTPAYVLSNAVLKPPLHQRRSQQRGRPGGSGGPKVINLPLQQDVKLHQTKNAWKPIQKLKKEPTAAEEVDELEEMLKKVRGILNKLTPQKFQVLLQQVIDLGINTEDKLAGTIDITFEKAISEPNFSVAYANLCKCLSDLKVPTASNPKEFVVFRKLLLNRCQKEFQKDKTDLLDIEKIQKAIDEASTPERKKELLEEKQLAEQRARQRSLGNIRFIGELFKLKMLTENIMHDCLNKLLNSQDEDSLEALCRLLTTIGKDIDHEKARDKVSQYFHQLRVIVDSKKTSARVRFMIQDLIELRCSNWTPRRDENNPKTIEEIHKEAHEEEQRKKIMLSNANIDSKRKPGRGSGSRHSQQGDDGWTSVKPSRPQALDPARMKITKQPVDETIQLGPGGRPGSMGTWGRGSSGGSKASSKEDRSSGPGNRYSLLSSSGGSEGHESGRASYGRNPPSGSRESKGGRLSQGRDRGKTGAKVSQEKERESALAAARNIVGPRSASGSRTPIQSRNQSRESSRNRDRSTDMRPAFVKPKELPVEEIEKKTKSLMDEYLSVNDLKEALLCIEELESPQNLHVCVAVILTHVLDRSAKARHNASHLLREAIQKKVMTTDHYTQGLQEILECADDMAIDIPQIWKYLGELIGPMVEDGLWPLVNLKLCCRPLLRIHKAGVLAAFVLHDAAHRLGHIKVGELWRQNGMSWTDFLLPGENIPEFLRHHKLEYTELDDVPRSPGPRMLPMEQVQKELEQLIENQHDNEVVFDWINANIADEHTKDSAFIRALMTAVCSSSITRDGTICKVDVDHLKKRFILLQRFLDHDARLELQALYALQALIHKLEHPTEVLRIFFDALYDEDIISEDAFCQWESSKDPAEQAGKGVAVTSVVQFFTWLREAEEEEPAVN